MTILTISGSPARHSRSGALLAHLSQALVVAGHDVHEVGLRDIPADDLIGAHVHSPAARRLHALVEPASAVIIATPVYKASFSGGLKTLLDLLPENALAGKVVLPIATGGSLSHLLALEYALKPVLSALGARTILGGVFATDKDLAVLGDGEVAISRSIQERLEQALREFAAQLSLLRTRADSAEAAGAALPANAIAFPLRGANAPGSSAVPRVHTGS
jgi:FMN reductase